MRITPVSVGTIVRGFLFICVASFVSAALAAEPKENRVAFAGQKLALWEKRPAAPKRAIVLVHGRTWSSRPDFDLQVPGESRSVMDSLVARGYVVYALDLPGYGGSLASRERLAEPE